MKRILMVCLVFVFMFGGRCFAQEYDLGNMDSSELRELIELIEEELGANHEATSEQKTAVEKEIKSFIESFYGKDNVSWAWIDYAYSREWNFFTFETHADIEKKDGGEARYDIYGEVIADNTQYQAVYVKVGTEVLLDKRVSSIDDLRVLSLLGIEVQNDEEKSNNEQSEPYAETTVITIAQRGDKNETVRHIQEILIRLGYLSGGADGDFGGKTEEAVQAFQKDNGMYVDGIVTQEVLEAIEGAFAVAPVPVEYPHFTAAELYKKFEDNQIAAEAELEGKEIKITGTIDSISENLWGTPYVSLKADSYGFETIDCYFSDERINEIVSLKTGNKVTILGTCGTMSFMSIEVKECRVMG